MAKNADGRSTKSEAHRKAISEGLKRYWASQKKRNPNAGKLTAHGKKKAAERRAGKTSTKDFADWHKRHEANQRARANAAKKFYNSPEGKRNREIQRQIRELSAQAQALRLKVRVGRGKSAKAQLDKIDNKLAKLRAESRRLRKQSWLLKKKDGRYTKSAAHRKAISEGLKRYHAGKSKNKPDGVKAIRYARKIAQKNVAAKRAARKAAVPSAARWKDMTAKEQRSYVKDNPNSKFAKYHYPGSKY